MAAGLGFKTFTTGEVLTAADTNGYLMQGINVFASTAARDAAITSPQEGQFAFTKDTNGLWYYDGAAWVASGATGDIEGVTAGIGISGGGTSGTVTVTNSMATAIDAKGDLVAGTGADAFSRLAVGANDTVLTADSAQATGLKWATASAPTTTWTLINAGGTALTGAATITVSSISGKTQLFIMVRGASSATALSVMSLRLNADTGSNYVQVGGKQTGSSDVVYQDLSQTSFSLGKQDNNANGKLVAGLWLSGTNSTDIKVGNQYGLGENFGSSQNDGYMTFNTYAGTSAISSVSIISSLGNFDAGTIYVYGA